MPWRRQATIELSIREAAPCAERRCAIFKFHWVICATSVPRSTSALATTPLAMLTSTFLNDERHFDGCLCCDNRLDERTREILSARLGFSSFGKISLRCVKSRTPGVHECMKAENRNGFPLNHARESISTTRRLAAGDSRWALTTIRASLVCF